MLDYRLQNDPGQASCSANHLLQFIDFVSI